MDFSELLSSDGPVILDGAMGTELERRGCPGGGVQCLQNPQTVADIHRECVAAGSQVIITNSLTMNRAYLESHGLDVSVRKVNTAAARLARSTGDVFVLGNLSSSGSLLAPYGEKSEEELVGVFQEQALYLTRGGVDGLIIETMFDLNEALCAVRGCLQITTLPVLVLMAFSSSDRGPSSD